MSFTSFMLRTAFRRSDDKRDAGLTTPEGIERFDELRAVLPALQLFGDIADEDVSPDSLVREFIGGGIYEY